MYLAEVEGKGGINTKLVAYSVSPEGKKIATFELTYHRYIHGEFMTHRLFSRNAMSSRAVPVNKMLDIIRESPAMPIHWGKNQPGMQAKEEHDAEVIVSDYDGDDWPISKERAWELASNHSVRMAECFAEAGYHKQIVNRLVEPFQMMKTVMTATELDNFFWLRLDEDAQPEIFELARCIRECLEKSEPQPLQPGEWHTPYVYQKHSKSTGIHYFIYDEKGQQKFITKDEALAISSSCCAQVSYRNLDNTYEKAMAIYGRLLSGAKVHASPFEHQATPMAKRDLSGIKSERGAVNFQPIPDSWEKGITHVDREGNFWSANFKGWVQHRQLLDNHNCTDYVPE
jgi:hypothetical protein